MKKIVAVALVASVLLGIIAVAGWAIGRSGRADRRETSKLKQERVTLKIGYLPITHSLPLVVADKRNRGKYQNVRLELVKFSSWPELMEALNSGRIDGAISMLELAMVSAERGVPIEILALSHRNGDAITAAQDIRSVKELKGQRVAVPHRISGHYILLYQALKDNGLTLDDVQWVEMAPPDMPAALARGEVKAYVVAEPFGAKAVLGGFGKTLLVAQDIWKNWICCGLIVGSEVKERNPAAVRELVESLVEAGSFIERDRTSAIKIALEYMKIEEAAWRKSFELGISYADLKPKPKELVRLADYLQELKLTQAGVQLDRILDDSYVTDAYKKE